jgi:hypothetical protein
MRSKFSTSTVYRAAWCNKRSVQAPPLLPHCAHYSCISAHYSLYSANYSAPITPPITPPSTPMTPMTPPIPPTITPH